MVPPAVERLGDGYDAHTLSLPSAHTQLMTHCYCHQHRHSLQTHCLCYQHTHIQLTDKQLSDTCPCYQHTHTAYRHTVPVISTHTTYRHLSLSSARSLQTLVSVISTHTHTHTAYRQTAFRPSVISTHTHSLQTVSYTHLTLPTMSPV